MSFADMPPIFQLAIVTLVIGYIVEFFVWIVKHLRLRKMMKDIPGPKTYPFIGIAFQLVPLNHDELYQWFMDTCYQYKKGMVLTWLGTEPIVHIRRPQQMEALLPNTKNIKKSSVYDMIKPWLGRGLLTSAGVTWEVRRKLLTPTFHFAILESFSGIMSEKAEIFCECIQSRLDKNPNQPVNIFPMAIRCTLDTFCETAMGVCEDLQRKPDTEYMKAIQRFQILGVVRSFRPWLSRDFVYRLTSSGRDFFKSIDIMHDFTRKVIEQKQEERLRMKNLPYERDELNRHRKRAFLDHLMDACDEEPDNSRLEPEQIREEVDTFMFAGHDTTAAAICWCLFALGNNPDIQDKVHQELNEVFRNNKTPATTKQLIQLKYLERVMKETLRYYPSVPVIGRNLDTDVEIDGFKIPQGTTIFIQLMQMHRDPEVWENPHVFDPDRFLPENVESRHPYAYVPFSAGPRNCIGQKFAMLEFKTVLTAILRKYEIKSVKKSSEMKTISHFLLKPENDTIDLIFKPVKLK